jgi:hypothetical protein
MQQFRKYAAVLELLPDNGPCTTMDELLEAVFSMWSAPRLHHLTDRIELVSAVEYSVVE